MGLIKTVAICATAFGLVACGGGGDEDSTPGNGLVSITPIANAQGSVVGYQMQANKEMGGQKGYCSADGAFIRVRKNYSSSAPAAEFGCVSGGVLTDVNGILQKESNVDTILFGNGTTPGVITRIDIIQGGKPYKTYTDSTVKKLPLVGEYTCLKGIALGPCV